MLSAPQPSSLLYLRGADLGCLHVAGAGLRLEDKKQSQGTVQPDFVLYPNCIFKVVSSLSDLCPHPGTKPSDQVPRPRRWGPWDWRICAGGESGGDA